MSKTINFKSTIKQNGEEQIIEFSSPVTIEKEGKFEVFSFTEPNSDVHNRIELSEDEINIFASSTTVVLKKGNPIEFPLSIYLEDGTEQTFELVSEWIRDDFLKSNYYLFEYTLSRVVGSESVLIGSYTIELTIV
ncbi:hypothetical protein [Mycoplasmopsis gallopavonis]|uniref:Uncharacterized protein n=1 Tax=Mycoplasmopsis gallopavonis TaxID=76629 RepID=A0A449AZ48_9BACT|nr:hypothetical protein [Mycoplasmopsis gallopavonis]RIV16825.1 hypothetical protein D1113_00850 [Mycoplasmopsis gallopavonis]VEU72808.1 Uncharacterised protein [Mycoplasmopsis gallopavonis]